MRSSPYAETLFNLFSLALSITAFRCILGLLNVSLNLYVFVSFYVNCFLCFEIVNQLHCSPYKNTHEYHWLIQSQLTDSIHLRVPSAAIDMIVYVRCPHPFPLRLLYGLSHQRDERDQAIRTVPQPRRRRSMLSRYMQAYARCVVHVASPISTIYNSASTERRQKDVGLPYHLYRCQEVNVGLYVRNYKKFFLRFLFLSRFNVF